MENITRSYHLKLQEMCDCYLETDFLAQMKDMAGTDSQDVEEDAIKYLALAIMFAITRKAETLSFKKKGEELQAKVKNGSKEKLPVPNGIILDKVFEIMRTILHIEQDKGELEFSLGLQTGEVNVMVKMDRGEGRQSLKIKFPKQ